MKKKIALGILSLLLTGLAIVGVWVNHGLDALEQPAPVSEAFLFEVEPGSTYSGVVHQLQQEGIVENAFWLRLHARLQGRGTLLKAGTYEITPGMSPLDAIDMMVAGRTKSWQVRFIEGWTFADVRVALAQHEHLDHTLTGLSDQEVMAALGHPDLHPEGRFFPDTYRYKAGETDLSILRRAFERLNRVLEEEWRQRADGLPYDSAYEALIMASIVEKETGVPEERPAIAGVFVRRLEKGMRLQTDPTVIYGLGDRYTGNLTRQHLLADNPYNTYRNSGLPPTPIALAGREAIHAALHPAEGEALYFVAKGDGSHAFSATLAEHRGAVQHYQIEQRSDDYRSSPAPVE